MNQDSQAHEYELPPLFPILLRVTLLPIVGAVVVSIALIADQKKTANEKSVIAPTSDSTVMEIRSLIEQPTSEPHWIDIVKLYESESRIANEGEFLYDANGGVLSFNGEPLCFDSVVKTEGLFFTRSQRIASDPHSRFRCFPLETLSDTPTDPLAGYFTCKSPAGHITVVVFEADNDRCRYRPLTDTPELASAD